MTRAPHPSEDVSVPVPGEWLIEAQRRAEECSHKNALTLELRDPPVAARILWMLAQGVPKLRIHQATGVCRKVIARMAWDNRETLETKKKEFSREYAIVAESYKDLLLEKAAQLEDDPEQLKAISPDKLAITMAIATDKAMLLAGMASTVVEFRKGASIDDAAKMIAEARARVANKLKSEAIDAEVITTQ